jgi:hypothetical protein
MVPSCSLRINRGATAGIFDVDRTGKDRVAELSRLDEVRVWRFASSGWMTLLLPDLSIGPVNAEAITMLTGLLLCCVVV